MSDLNINGNLNVTGKGKINGKDILTGLSGSSVININTQEDLDNYIENQDNYNSCILLLGSGRFIVKKYLIASVIIGCTNNGSVLESVENFEQGNDSPFSFLSGIYYNVQFVLKSSSYPITLFYSRLHSFSHSGVFINCRFDLEIINLPGAYEYVIVSDITCINCESHIDFNTIPVGSSLPTFVGYDNCICIGDNTCTIYPELKVKNLGFRACRIDGTCNPDQTYTECVANFPSGVTLNVKEIKYL